MIYLDNNATTRTDPRVLEAMLPFFCDHYGNAASLTHAVGRRARKAVDEARAAIATAIGAQPAEIVFTSGATESDNLAVKGIARAVRSGRPRIVTSATEHKAVLDACKRLEHEGVSVAYAPPGSDGLLDMDALAHAITPGTALVSVMHANNEIGVVQDIAEIGCACRQKGVVFHTDCAQSVGKTALDLRAMNVDLASFTAHKIYGPKGIGALYVSAGLRERGIELLPEMDGGGHERGFRSGTLNVPGIVGLATALALCLEDLEAESARLVEMRRRLEAGLRTAMPETRINGHPDRRLAGNLSVTFPGVDAGSLMLALNDVACSAGSACSSTSAAPSHVLKAIGLTDQDARSTIRFGLGRFNTPAEIDCVVARVAAFLTKARR